MLVRDNMSELVISHIAFSKYGAGVGTQEQGGKRKEENGKWTGTVLTEKEAGGLCSQLSQNTVRVKDGKGKEGDERVRKREKSEQGRDIEKTRQRKGSPGPAVLQSPRLLLGLCAPGVLISAELFLLLRC